MALKTLKTYTSNLYDKGRNLPLKEIMTTKYIEIVEEGSLVPPQYKHTL